MRNALTLFAMLTALLACSALPSYADDTQFEPVYDVAEMSSNLSQDPAIAPVIDQGPSINVLIDRVIGWAPNWIVEPIKVWANYLIIGSSILMLFLRVLIWILPASISDRFNWILGPVATFFRQLTRVLDLIAINSNSRMGGPNKNRRRG